MSNIDIHTVLLDPTYAKIHYKWLQRFVYRTTEENGEHLYVFTSTKYTVFQGNFVEFEVLMKGGEKEAIKERVMLPLSVVAGILLDEEKNNSFGFIGGHSSE